MNVSLAYALPDRQVWFDLKVDEDASVVSAIYTSGVLDLFPQIDLTTQKVGIFGRTVTLETKLAAGDRVEIYRPVTWQPPQLDEDDDDD